MSDSRNGVVTVMRAAYVEIECDEGAHTHVSRYLFSGEEHALRYARRPEVLRIYPDTESAFFSPLHLRYERD